MNPVLSCQALYCHHIAFFDLGTAMPPRPGDQFLDLVVRIGREAGLHVLREVSDGPLDRRLRSLIPT